MCWLLREDNILVQVLVCSLAVVSVQKPPTDILVQRLLYLRLCTEDSCARVLGCYEQIREGACYASYSSHNTIQNRIMLLGKRARYGGAVCLSIAVRS